MTRTTYSRERREQQGREMAAAAVGRTCPECLHAGAMVRITNGTRCRLCGVEYRTKSAAPGAAALKRRGR
jgi:uncharacterized protein (DUF983 family)